MESEKTMNSLMDIGYEELSPEYQKEQAYLKALFAPPMIALVQVSPDMQQKIGSPQVMGWLSDIRPVGQVMVGRMYIHGIGYSIERLWTPLGYVWALLKQTGLVD